MREILFKAKRMDNGEWVEGYLWSKRTIGYTSPIGNTDEIVVDPETVCECTGLTDKNGVKIFEGDIIIHDTKSLIDEKRFDKGHVLFEIETAKFLRTSYEEPERRFEMWKCNSSDYEVIGNIHDKEG